MKKGRKKWLIAALAGLLGAAEVVIPGPLTDVARAVMDAQLRVLDLEREPAQPLPGNRAYAS